MGRAAEAPRVRGEDVEALPREKVHQAVRRLPRNLEVEAFLARRGRAVGQDDEALARGAPHVLLPNVEPDPVALHPVLHPGDLLGLRRCGGAQDRGGDRGELRQSSRFHRPLPGDSRAPRRRTGSSGWPLLDVLAKCAPRGSTAVLRRKSGLVEGGLVDARRGSNGRRASRGLVRAGFNRSALVAALAVRELLDLDAARDSRPGAPPRGAQQRLLRQGHLKARVIRSSSANRTMSSRLRGGSHGTAGTLPRSLKKMTTPVTDT